MLGATAHDGAGLFGQAACTARTRSIGGIVPPTGCDSGHPCVELRLPYTAACFTPISR